MADDINTKEKDPPPEALDASTPVHEEASNTFAAQYLDELFKRVKEDNKGSAGDTKPSSGAEPRPGNYDYHPGAKPGLGDDASRNLQGLFSKVKEGDPATVQATEKFGDGKGNLRVFKMDGAEKATGQIVDDKGKATTRIDEKTSIEYDPATGKYTKIDDKTGKRTDIDPNTSTEKFGPQGKTLKELIRDGVSTETAEKTENGPKTEKTTFLDGSVRTKFPDAKDGECKERTTYPPGRADGLRESEKFNATPPGDTSKTSAREVKNYTDRKETSFEKGDIAKVTAFKNPEDGKPAAIIDYAKDGDKYKGPDGAKTVEKYRDNGDPKGVKEVVKYDGNKPDMITFNNGVKAERPANGDIRTGVGTGEQAGILDVNKENGMPTHMKIGDRDYTVTYKNGKVDSMTVEQAGPPKSTLEMKRNDKGELEVKKADGKFAPDANGKINMEGLPIQTKDGKVVGDVHLNKSGDLKYKTGDGPDRHELIRRADGSTEDLDFKNWKKTITSADGKTKSEKAWDGYEWRDFKMSADGKRTEFQPPDPKKPAFIERDTSGTPPGDKTRIGYGDGSKVDCDWKNGTQTETSADGKKQTVRHYDGHSYREGTVVEDPSKVLDPRTGQPLGDKAKGDKVVVFKEGEPKVGLLRQDGSSVAIYQKEGEQAKDATVVEKGPNGQISEVKSPKGHFKFEQDADGDISKMTELNADGSVKQVLTRKGAEKDPGMQQWLGREGADKPRQPGDKPPRDPFNPKGFNEWEVRDKDGNLVKGEDGKPITKNMNIHTTSDGSIRFEHPGKDGQPPNIVMRTPRGETYRDTPDAKVTPRPGGVSEFVDKKTGETRLEFTRNGEKITVNSKDGGYAVMPDGTVVQQSKDGKQLKHYLPDGSQATHKIENGKQIPVELKIAKNDPNKPGEYQTLTPGTPPVKSLELAENGRYKAVITGEKGDIPTVFDLKQRTKSEQMPGENFARAYNMDTGKFTGVNNANGEPLLKVKDGKATLKPTDRALDPKDWKFGPEDISADKDGNLIIKSAKPGSSDQLLMKPNGTVVETIDGKEKTTFPNKMEATFNADGTVKTVRLGNKDYVPKMEGDKIVGLKPADGQGPEIEPLPKGTRYNSKLNENGAFVAESKDGDTTIKNEWSPTEGKYSVEKTWPTKDGGTASMSYVADKDGKVTHFSLPPDRKSTSVAQARRTFKDLQASVGEDGSLTIQIDANSKMVVNKDGSSDQTLKRGGVELVNHRDRDGKLLPTEKQAEDLGKLLEADLSKPENQQKLAQELMSRFLFSDQDKVGKDQESFLKALNEKLASRGVSVAVETVEGKPTVVVSRSGGQPIKIPLG